SGALLYLINRGFNFSKDDPASWQFTHTIRERTKFALDFARLIEFNDLDENQIYTEGDTIIRNYSLRTDITWNIASLKVNLTENSIQISITGTCKDQTNQFTIELFVTLYFTPETIEFRGHQVTIPSNIALKFGLNITGYHWSEGASSSRYLALVIVLHSCVGDSYQYRYRWANGEVVANGSSGLVPSIVNDGSISEIYFVDSAGNPVALFNWFNGAYNGIDDCICRSSFCLNNETINITIAFPYQDFQDGNIYIDPYFQFLGVQQNYLPLFLAFYALTQFYMSQAKTVILLVVCGGLSAIVLIGVALLLARKK
ncbi:MAG: hypothetical protein QXV37_02075, partial [Candidatus Jordarchaeaceae archaeon]